jgi:hypothetical protein
MLRPLRGAFPGEEWTFVLTGWNGTRPLFAVAVLGARVFGMFCDSVIWSPGLD